MLNMPDHRTTPTLAPTPPVMPAATPLRTDAPPLRSDPDAALKEDRRGCGRRVTVGEVERCRLCVGDVADAGVRGDMGVVSADAGELAAAGAGADEEDAAGAGGMAAGIEMEGEGRAGAGGIALSALGACIGRLV